MRRAVVNEIEERRVIRLLAELADRLPGLSEDDVYAFVVAASAPAGRRRPRRFQSSARSLPAVAAAAVVAIGVSLQLARPAADSSSGVRAESASIVSFPAGNALELLIAAEQRGEA